MMPLEESHAPRPGVAVISSDGARLGTVKETSGSFFKIDAPMHRDYWLSEQLVKARDESGLLLDIPRAQVAEHRLDEPGLEPADDPFSRISKNAVLTGADMLEQRAHMERELAEQSRKLPPHEPSPTETRGPQAYERIPADHTGFGDLAGGYVPNAPVHDRLEMEQHGGRRAGFIAAAMVTAVIALLAIVVAYRRRTAGHHRRVRDHAIGTAHVIAEHAHDASHVLAAKAHDASHRIADRTAAATHETAEALPPRRELRRMAARRGASFAGRVEHALERVA